MKAALDFTGPDRVPRDLWTLPYIPARRKDELGRLLEEFPMDIGNAVAAYPPGLITTPVYAETGEYTDEWGSRSRLLINPKTWREVFKPLYRQYCDLIHSAGKHIFFHSDGYIMTIYGDLIEVGIDAINSQLFTMDIEELGRLYRGKVTFWGEMNRQYTLPFGSPEDVYADVQRVRRALDTGQGGVIAQYEWDKIDPARNIRTVYQSWLGPHPSVSLSIPIKESE